MIAPVPLRVSDNKRFLVDADGKPFFYLADTAWELFHRLDRGAAEHYLINRAGKGFNAIQAVLLAEINGLSEPNANGDLPLIDMDPARPNEKYFAHVDHIVDFAARVGLYVAMLPTWGAHVVKENHPLFPNTPVFNPGNARVYGRFLGERYRHRPNVLWILGGDRPPTGVLEIWRAMAAGIREGEAGGIRHLMTYHPQGGRSSSEWLHDEPWLDFNLLQSGHSRRAEDNYSRIAADYARTPIKPCMDGEPCYEDLPVGFNAANRMWFDDYDVRVAAYWSVFAGAMGHTYGTNAIWQMWTPDRKSVLTARRTWREAMDLPGAYHMGHLRRLMESRPFLTRIPDQSLIISGQGKATDHVQATRDGTPGSKDATCLMAYTPMAKLIEVDTSVIRTGRIRAYWFDPRQGVAYPQADVENRGRYTAPWHTQPWENQGPDWVLIVEAVE